MNSAVAASTFQSLRTLLAGAIDYAGMYPPAKLPLAQAWTNYLAYRRSPEAWMLGHFVAPLADVPRLAELAAGSDFAPLASLAVVVPPAASGRELLDRLRGFRHSTNGPLTVAAMETRLPDDILAASRRATTAQFALEASAACTNSALFLEGPATGLQHVAGLADASAKPGSRLGFKLRTGGLEAAAFPAVDEVAAVIDACRRHALPWKATAGLHHPLRQFRAEVGAPMHGFVNVLAAAVLAEANSLPADALARILADESPDDFCFSDERLVWGGFAVSLEQIRTTRSSGMLSFGSCSFDEPCDDLRALGWLAP